MAPWRMPIRPWFVAAVLALSACGGYVQPPAAAPGPPAAQVVGTLPPQADPREPAVTFAVWSDGALRPGVLAAARAFDGIVSAGATATGTSDLRAIEGDARYTPPGQRTMSILAVDPAPLAFDPSLARVAASLRGGEAAVSALTAERRGIHKNDRLYLGDGTVSVRVTSVTSPEALFSHELVVPLTMATPLGLDRSPAVIVAARPGAVPDAAAALIKASGDDGRIRALAGYTDEHGTVMATKDVHRIFGEFRFVRGPGDAIIPDPAWVRAAIIDWTVPVLGRVRCHRAMLGQLAYAMAEIEQAGLGAMIDSYDGCYVPRFQRLDDTKLSAHAYGIAIDLNAATNAQGDDTPEIDPRIVSIMERWGFAWGGRFGTPDGMHFEIARMVRLPR